MTNQAIIPSPPIEPFYLTGLYDKVLANAKAARIAEAERLPRLRVWLYQVMLFFRWGDIQKLLKALYDHRVAVQRDKEIQQIENMLKNEARLYLKIIKHRLAYMGWNEVERVSGRRKIRQYVRFSKPVYMNENAFYYRILTSRQGLVNSESAIPYGTSTTKLVDDNTIHDLSMVLNRKLKAVFIPRRGLWYIVYRNEDMSGLPRLVQFSQVLEQFEDGQPDICLGVTEQGKVAMARLGKVPHALVAGGTGTGKSVMLNQIICGFIRHNTPAQLKLLLIDLKTVEFFDYAQVDPTTQQFLPERSIPHLVGPVIKDSGETITVLKRVLALIKSRYAAFAGRARNIDDYNKRRPESSRIPRLVVIIDELGEVLLDINTKRGQEAERLLLRIAQLGRAAGVHIIAATQRPSKDIVTPNILAQLDLKFSGRMARSYDSMTVMGTGDAADLENVPGRSCYKLGPDVVRVQPPLIERPKIMESIGIAMLMEPYELALPDITEADEILADEQSPVDYVAGLKRLNQEAGGRLDIHTIRTVLGMTQGQASIFQERVANLQFEHHGEQYQVVQDGRTWRIKSTTRAEKTNGRMRYPGA